MSGPDTINPQYGAIKLELHSRVAPVPPDSREKLNRWQKQHATFVYCKDLSEPELLDLLGHRNSYIRTAAVEKLQNQRNEKLADHMLELCSASDYRLRSSGAGILGCLPISAKEKFEKIVNILSSLALKDGSIEVRRSAIYALGYRYSIERKGRGFIFSTLARTAEDANASPRLPALERSAM